MKKLSPKLFTISKDTLRLISAGEPTDPGKTSPTRGTPELTVITSPNYTC